MTDKKTQAEKEAQDVWTRNQEYGGVGEAHDPETVVVEEGADDCFSGFAADEEVDVEKQLDDEFDEMERGGNE